MTLGSLKCVSWSDKCHTTHMLPTKATDMIRPNIKPPRKRKPPIYAQKVISAHKDQTTQSFLQVC